MCTGARRNPAACGTSHGDGTRRFSPPLRAGSPCPGAPSSLLLSSLELSDTKVYEPYIRALLGTASRFCEVGVLKSRTVSRRSRTQRYHPMDYGPFIKSQLASTQLTSGPCVVQIWSRNARICSQALQDAEMKFYAQDLFADVAFDPTPLWKPHNLEAGASQP